MPVCAGKRLAICEPVWPIEHWLMLVATTAGACGLSRSAQGIFPSDDAHEVEFCRKWQDATKGLGSGEVGQSPPPVTVGHEHGWLQPHSRHTTPRSPAPSALLIPSGRPSPTASSGRCASAQNASVRARFVIELVPPQILQRLSNTIRAGRFAGQSGPGKRVDR